MANKKKPEVTEEKKSTFEVVEGRATGRISPLGIVIPGVDTKVNDGDPLYDERRVKAAAKLAPWYDPALEDAYKRGDNVAPLEVIIDGKGAIIVVDGGRRAVHARFAGASLVDFVVLDITNPAALFLAQKRANLGRVNATAMEQARDIDRARREFDLALKDVAPSMGLKEDVARQRLSLLFLEPSLQPLTELPDDSDDYLPMSVAIQLAKIKKPATDKAAREETDEARDARFARQLAVYARMKAAGTLTEDAVRREKNAATDEGSDDGYEGSEDGEEAPAKKTSGMTTAELRKIVARHAEGDKAFAGLTPEFLAFVEVVTGTKGLRTVPGLVKAMNAIRGVTPREEKPEATEPKAPRAPRTKKAKATEDATPAAE